MSPQIMTSLFLTFLGLKLVIQYYLNFRNKKYVLHHRLSVPEMFSSKISLNDHQKAADYTVAKLNLGQFSLGWDTLILLFWTLGGGINLLEQNVSSWGFSPLISGAVLIGLFSLLESLLGLPENLYQTFVLEEKFGFNRTTIKTFLSDLLKQFILGMLIGFPFLLGILWIMKSLGEYWWFYAWVFISLFQLVLLWAYPTFIAPLFNKFSPLEEGEVKERILSLLRRIDLSFKDLFVMDASKRSAHGNAYFTGFGKNKRIVFFDNLLKNLTPSEVEAVLAHELGHFKNKHILKAMIRSFVFSLIGLWLLGLLAKSSWFYLGHNIQTQSNATVLLLFILVSPVYTFFLTPIFSWWSRKNEFEADQFASTNSNGRDLIEALVKLYKDNASSLTLDPLYTTFYHSHPPALERIQHLEKLQGT